MHQGEVDGGGPFKRGAAPFWLEAGSDAFKGGAAVLRLVEAGSGPFKSVAAAFRLFPSERFVRFTLGPETPSAGLEDGSVPSFGPCTGALSGLFGSSCASAGGSPPPP